MQRIIKFGTRKPTKIRRSIRRFGITERCMVRNAEIMETCGGAKGYVGVCSLK